MSYLGDYHSWNHAHKQAVYMRDHDAATRSRIVYAVTNDRLTRDTAKNVFELIDDLRKSDAENDERVMHILGMRPTATESASKLKLEASAPDLLAALEAAVQDVEAAAFVAKLESKHSHTKANLELARELDSHVAIYRAAVAKAKGVTP